MTTVVVCGALGRMGNTIGRMVNESEDLTLVGGVDIRPGTLFGVEVVESARIDDLLASKKPDVVIDFTIANAAVQNVKSAARHHAALVVGTTGFSAEQREEMRKAIEGHVPAVISSNFSIGVNIYWELLRSAARSTRGVRYRGARGPPPVQERCTERNCERRSSRSSTRSSGCGRRNTAGKG